MSPPRKDQRVDKDAQSNRNIAKEIEEIERLHRSMKEVLSRVTADNAKQLIKAERALDECKMLRKNLAGKSSGVESKIGDKEHTQSQYTADLFDRTGKVLDICDDMELQIYEMNQRMMERALEVISYVQVPSKCEV
jgi:hypothetical protein